jgi:hypothetical protein
MRFAALGSRLIPGLLAVAALLGAQSAAAEDPFEHPSELQPVIEHLVPRRLAPPAEEREAYAARLRQTLAQAGAILERTQFVLLIDRSAFVQAAMVWWLAPDGTAGLVGAVPVSTGRPSGFEHFETPLGVFEHSLDHPDFRAEGTFNELGIRGYGERGRRIFDFGWDVAQRGWAPGAQAMRLQLHATDPRHLEPRLGQRQSKGCIRVSGAFNEFLDRFGVLDAAYDEALAQGRSLWVLRRDRVTTPWAGRWLVVIESARSARPAWSPFPWAPDAAEPAAPSGSAPLPNASGQTGTPDPLSTGAGAAHVC